MKDKINVLIFITLLMIVISYKPVSISQSVPQIQQKQPKVIDKNKLLIDSIFNLRLKFDSNMEKTRAKLVLLKHKQVILEKEVTSNKKNR